MQSTGRGPSVVLHTLIDFDQCRLGQVVQKSASLSTNLPLNHWNNLRCQHQPEEHAERDTLNSSAYSYTPTPRELQLSLGTPRPEHDMKLQLGLGAHALPQSGHTKTENEREREKKKRERER